MNSSTHRILLYSHRADLYAAEFIKQIEPACDLVTNGERVIECILTSSPASPARVVRLLLYPRSARDVMDVSDPYDILWGYQFPEPLLNDSLTLQWVQTVSAGVDHLLLTSCLPERVILTNAGGFHGPPIAEYVMAALLGFVRGLTFYSRFQPTGGIRHTHLRVLSEATLGIVGTGSIGRSIAEKARLFGMRVLGLSRSGAKSDFFETVYAQRELTSFLPQCQFLVLAAPLTPDTRYFINADTLSSLPDRVFIVNIGRAGLVDERALLESLKLGHCAGAVLDVWEGEKPNAALLACEHVICTPHISGLFPGYVPAATSIFIDNLFRFVEHRPLVSTIDRSRGY